MSQDQKVALSHTPPQSWGASRARNTTDSNESDSGVSEVKLDDEDLHDEVIVIDLDDESITTQYIPSSNVSEQSLEPREHRALMQKTHEKSNNNSTSATSTESVSSDKTKLNTVSVITTTDADDSKTASGGYTKSDTNDLVSWDQEREYFLVSQKALFAKLNRLLRVVTDKPNNVSENEPSVIVSPNSPSTVLPVKPNMKAFNMIKELRRRKQHSRLVLTCSTCGKGFPSIGILNKHERIAHPEPKPHIPAPSVLSPHHSPPAPHHSPPAPHHSSPARPSYSSPTPRSPTTPPSPTKRSPLKLRAYPCSKCGEYFQSQALLHEHKRAIHNLLSQFLCLECDKSFGSRGQLQSHKKWKHTPAKPKPPPLPTSPITTKAMLKEVYFPDCHTESSDLDINPDDERDADYVPAGPKPKRKRGRPRKYNNNTIDTDNNQNVSAQPKEYKCRYCDIFFYQISSLYQHEQTHDVEKTLSCNMCSASFVQQASLNRHLKTHQNVRYVCDVCGLVYVQTYSVMYHRQKNHPEAQPIKSKQLRVQLDGPPTPMQTAGRGRKKTLAK